MADARRLFGMVLILILFANVGNTQPPFDCAGRMFRVIEEEGGSTFEELILQESPLEILFEPLAFFPDNQLNGICYRPKDNLIYGLELGDTYRLIRIDASFQLAFLADLPLPSQLYFVAGDISPDGRYLVLLGFGQNEETNILALVDLEDPDYATQLYPMQTMGTKEAIFCADIAFHPTTGQLYGYDQKMDRLIIIDYLNREVDDLSFAQTGRNLGSMPSIFFDPNGRLFGIASRRNTFTNRAVYEFNLNSGRVIEHQELEVEKNQDACSCPFEMQLYNEVKYRKAYPCTDLLFTLRLVNRTPYEQTNVQLRDTFPPSIKIKKIEYSGYQYDRQLSGVGTSVLAIDGLNIPIGEDSIILHLEVAEETPKGIYRNQAFLYNVNAFGDLEPEMRVSDDPKTVDFGDPTAYEIASLALNFQEEALLLCAGDQLKLDPGIAGALSYQWSNGSSDPYLYIEQGGQYRLKVETSCGETQGTIYVEEDRIEVDLGETISAEIGQTVELQPTVVSNSPIVSYFWSSAQGSEDIPCFTCERTSIEIKKDAWYKVQVENENGCLATDRIGTDIVKFEFFAPTAFSPDGNGQNDYFYLNGARDFAFENFQIFNRWGARVFHLGEGKANQEEQGWDGRYKGQLQNAGAYIWSAQIKRGNGVIKQVSGQINLIR